jgi:hypothetical protein
MRTKKVLTLQARGLQSLSPTPRELSNGLKTYCGGGYKGKGEKKIETRGKGGQLYPLGRGERKEGESKGSYNRGKE